MDRCKMARKDDIFNGLVIKTNGGIKQPKEKEIMDTGNSVGMRGKREMEEGGRRYMVTGINTRKINLKKRKTKRGHV